MRRDLIFFVNGVPENLIVHDRHYFFASVSNDIIQEIPKLGADIEYWLKKSRQQFHAFGLRNDFAEENEAINDAHEKLSGILDAYSFLTEDAVPEIWPIVQVRNGGEAHAIVKFFSFRAWYRIHSKDGMAEKAWQQRNQSLLERMLALFDVATGNAMGATDLSEQIQLSAKMFRHGRSSDAYGIDYLCKFTALEGLVCGPRRHGHSQLLKQRLGVLFRHRSAINQEVTELWERRCEASHQGKAFSTQFSSLLDKLDHLTLGVLVFAVDHLNRVKTVDELWDCCAANYTLPPEASMERPSEIRRGAVISMVGGGNVQWNNVGRLVDAIFASKDVP